MGLILDIIWRILIVLTGAWLVLAIVGGTALMVVSFKRRHEPRRIMRVVACPMCDGAGARINEAGNAEICPLCDGESALAEQVPELDAG